MLNTFLTSVREHHTDTVRGVLGIFRIRGQSITVRTFRSYIIYMRNKVVFVEILNLGYLTIRGAKTRDHEAPLFARGKHFRQAWMRGTHGR